MMRTSVPALLALALSLGACAVEPDYDSDDPILPDEPLASQASALSGDDIGVVPEDGVNCPGKRVTVRIFTEKDDNNNQKSGWNGDWWVTRNVNMVYCKVSGDDFKPVKSTLANDNYAVLKLGATCPAGSYDLVRYFDANDLRNGQPWFTYDDEDAAYPPSHHGGKQGNNLWLHMCVFKAKTSGSSTPFPNLGFSYGVLGGSGLPGVKETGWVYSDDEDDSNNNGWENPANLDVSSIMSDNDNTKIHLARVR